MWPFCIRKPCPRIHVRSGMQFPLVARETPSHSDRKFRDAFSARALNRKLYPTPKSNSGTHFPKPHPSGKPVPLCIHPANARERVFQNGFAIRVMENITPRRLPRLRPQVSKKASRTSRLSHLYCFARSTTNDEATRPARPSWRLRPCCPGPPWWDGPSRQPSCRAAS